MGLRSSLVWIAWVVGPPCIMAGRVRADPQLFVPIAAIEAAAVDAAIRATAAAAELEWRMSETAWGLRLDDVGLASLTDARETSSFSQWRPVEEMFAMGGPANGGRRAIEEDAIDPLSRLFDAAEGLAGLGASLSLLLGGEDAGRRRDVAIGDNAALASVVKQQSRQWDLGSADSDSLGGLLAMRGAPADIRVRMHRPVENTYYLDWPWVLREGRNVFFLLFGPPSLVLGIVMTIYIITRAARRVR